MTPRPGNLIWEEFMRDYQDKTPKYDLETILEAFFHYCRGHKEISDRLLK